MSNISISENEVHIWKLRFSEACSDPKEFYRNSLSQDEKERADKLKFPKDRTKFLLARGHLRSLLSVYLGMDPQEIELTYGSFGKPYLSKEAHPKMINFNLSHSNDTVLYAITPKRDVGIDVEYLRLVSRAQRIIERFFSYEEKEYYEKQPQEKKIEVFFKLWCRRESYTKAIGSSFNLSESKIDISFVTGEHKSTGDKTGKNAAVPCLYEITVDPGYTASLAISGTSPRILYRDIKETY